MEGMLKIFEGIGIDGISEQHIFHKLIKDPLSLLTSQSIQPTHPHAQYQLKNHWSTFFGKLFKCFAD
jgi:hypothetical protein